MPVYCEYFHDFVQIFDDESSRAGTSFHFLFILVLFAMQELYADIIKCNSVKE